MATSNVRYEPPSKADWAEIGTNPNLVSAVAEHAERGKQYGIALAAEFTESGHYASSFQVVPETVTRRGVPRAAARLENTAEYAAALEDGWGVEDRPPAHHILDRVKHLLDNA